jgi:hypothetical protein
MRPRRGPRRDCLPIRQGERVVHANTQLSRDTTRWANSPGPKGCRSAFASRRYAAGLDGQSSAAPRITTWRTHRDNAGYAEAARRL